MLDGSDQGRNSTSRQSFSSPSSLNSLRVSGRSRRRNDDSIRSYDYQRDVPLDQDGQVDGDVETVTEPLEMYDGGGGGGSRRRNTNTSLAPATQQVIKLVPNQGYNDSQNDCGQTYAATALSFPSILCIPCPCVSGPSAQNCPPTCVTYHPVDPSATQPMPQPSNMQAVTPHLPQSTTLPIPASSMVPQTQVNHIYTYGSAGQFERDHHFPPNMPAACCGQIQLPRPQPPPQPTCYETQQSCPWNPNNSFGSTSYFHESPQSTCGVGSAAQGCCPATSNDYRYFAPRRRRRCRREYYLQITKGKCRTGLEDDDSEDTGKGGTTGGPSRGMAGGIGRTMPGTRPTHFPINFRLQKASMNEPISRPALPPTRPALTTGRPAMPTMRLTARPNTSFTSKSSSSQSSSLNSSSRSLSSVATNRSASSSNSRKSQTNAAGIPVNQNADQNPLLKKIPPPAMKMADAGVTKNEPTAKPGPDTENTDSSAGKPAGNAAARPNHADRAHGHGAKPNVNGGAGKKVVFEAQGSKKDNSTDGERARFGSVPLIQETAASVLRKRHNEIRIQAIREMLEKDMRRLKHS